MKTLATLFTLLPLLAWASPVAEGPSAELEKRADKWCTLYPGLTIGYCREGTNKNYGNVHNITQGVNFGVRCLCQGESVSGNDIWDYIPGWGCYASATITHNIKGATSANCEAGVPACPEWQCAQF